MNQYAADYRDRDLFIVDAELDQRVAFIRRTYLHVFGAIAACASMIAVIVNTPAIAEPLSQLFFGNWWAVLLAFMVASYAAHYMAESGASPAMQYAGLGLYAFAEAMILAPILYLMHSRMANGDALILQAGILTMLIFGGLTGFVLITKSDFSFLRNFLSVLALAAMGLVVVSMFTSISLGTWFSVAMIVLMSGFILNETSNVLHHYHLSQHVAASLAIFSSVATLFWYVLRLVSAFDD